MPDLELFLLGVPQVVVRGQPVHLRTRKALALLAYLALEPGPHPRETLAALLWTGPQQRNALRVALHHVRTALTPGTLQVTWDSLHLPRENVWCDAEELLRGAGTPPHPGVFLRGLYIDGSADWDGWVERTTQALEVRAEAGGPRPPGLGPASDAMPAGPPAAQGAPPPALAWRSTERQAPSAARHAAPSAPPPSLPGPPLVGRAGLFAQMEVAWARGQVVFLRGEAGMGKTRLAEAFLNQRATGVVTVVSQPPDTHVPYAVHARSLRANLAFMGHPALPDRLRYQLARVVPELWPHRPRPLRSATDRLHFYDAYIDALAELHPLHPPQLFENVQSWDHESYRAGAYASVHGPARGAHVQAVMTYRPDELSPGMQATLRAVVEQGRAVVLDVPPLAVDEVHALLGHFSATASTALADQLHRFTGGNPFFTLEVARLLQESGDLTRPGPWPLSVSPLVRGVIAHRLSRLSKIARDTTRVAALAGVDFDFPVAAHVLGNELEVAEAFGELEAAGVFRGEQLAHDLLSEAVKALTPARVRMVLHRRLVNALRTSPVPAATLARHAVEGQLWLEAQVLLRQAAREAEQVLAYREARAFTAQAAALPAPARRASTLTGETGAD